MDKDTNKEKKNIYDTFDPVKYDRGGKEAEAIVWTSATLDKAVEALKKGLPLKANPFIGKNTMLLKPNLVFARTEEEIEDYIHCMEDPIYFASKCYIMNPDGLQAAVLRDYQEEYIRHCQKNRFSILRSCRQAGKCLTFFNIVNITISSSFINGYNKYKLANIFKKYHFYIDKNDNYVIKYLPLYELQNLFDNSFIWKIKYNLYKLISWQEKKDKKSVKKILKDKLNIIKRIFQIGQ